MMSRAEASVFWPGITPAITALRTNCNHCNRMAPSLPSAPPTPLVLLVYPFQSVCADFCHYKGVNYLVIVDRYSNWPIVERTSGGASGLIECLRRTFVTYEIPDELSSDGGPELTASTTRQFLKTWGVHHRLSSDAFPHSNCRAEVGVKTVKRLISDNAGPSGELDPDALQRAMRQYQNTPDRDTNLSPAMCVFGRAIRDFIPILPGRYQPHDTWRDTLLMREGALRNRHMKAAERLFEHTKHLPPLVVGDQVRIQNQTGHNPLKWDKTRCVIEVRQFDQYVVRVDGSGRVTIRNRKFLCKYSPVNQPTAKITIDTDLKLRPSRETQVIPTERTTVITDPDSLMSPPAAHTEQDGLVSQDFGPSTEPNQSSYRKQITPQQKNWTANDPLTPSHTPTMHAPRSLSPVGQGHKMQSAPHPCTPNVRVDPDQLIEQPFVDAPPKRSTRRKIEPSWLSDYVHSIIKFNEAE